jgi:glycosyltransferase involved in cell wall biosynthesis
MFNTSDVSVVIPSYNSRNTIMACLNSLMKQEAAPLEIIVVDSSTDDTAQIINRCFPTVKVRSIKQRIFPGPARNRGASMARGAIIAYIDADCVADPDWVRQIAAVHNEGHLVVGGAILVGNPSSRVAWAGHLGEFREFLPTGEPRPMIHIPTCNLSYRRILFETFGGFPDAYYPQEDLLFNYLLNQRDIQIWFDPAIRVRHFCREKLNEYLSHQHRIGRVTRSTLRRINMPGSSIARRGWLAWLASPLLGLIKFLRTAAIFSSQYPREAFQRPILFLLLFLGSIWWARGFAAGAQKGLSGIRGWNDPDEPIFTILMASGEASKQKVK